MRTESIAPLATVLATNSWARIGEISGDTLVCEAASERRGEVVALAEANGGLRELSEEHRSLEEVFRDLVSGNPVVGNSTDGKKAAS